MPTLTGTLAEITGKPIDPDSLHQVTVRAPSRRASLAEQARLVASVPVPVEVSPTGEISVELEPGPAVMLVEGEGLRDVYELGVTEDMTLLTEALQEMSPTRSWVESQMVQLRADAVAAAGDAAGAAGVAAGHREHVDSIRDLLDEAAQSNVAPYLTQTALNATYETGPAFVTADGKPAATLPDAISEASGRVGVPTSQTQTIHETLTIDKSGLTVSGQSTLNSALWAHPSMSGPLIALAPTGTLEGPAQSGILLEKMQVTSARGDGVAIGKLKDSNIEKMWVSGAARDGIKTGLNDLDSWNILLSAITAWNNGRDGINGAHMCMNFSYRDCSFVDNKRHGLTVSSQSVVDRCTFDGNAVANLNIENVHNVTARDNYFEGKEGVYDPANPKYQILVVNSRDIRLHGLALQVLPGTAIYVDNSTNVLLDELTSSFPENDQTQWGYIWSTHQAIGIYITASCRKVRIRNVTPVPIMFEDLASLDISNRATVAQVGGDKLAGKGMFAAGTGGLGNGWQFDGAGTAPAATLVTPQSAPNPQAQQVVTAAPFQGIRTAVTLEPNTDYTIVGMVQSDKDTYFGSSASAPFNGAASGPNLNFLNRKRLVARPFRTGATPFTHVGIWANQAGTTFNVEGLRIVKGRFDVADCPLT